MSRPLILDTNLLVLFVVGAVDEGLITRHKRLQAFNVEDYRQVLAMVTACSRLLLTPHVLTETSNLARQVREAAQAEVSAVLKLLIARFPEELVSSCSAVEHPRYVQLGLTDAVLLRLSATPGAVLLTTDGDLYGAALSEGRNAYNYGHFQAANYADHARPGF